MDSGRKLRKQKQHLVFTGIARNKRKTKGNLDPRGTLHKKLVQISCASRSGGGPADIMPASKCVAFART